MFYLDVMFTKRDEVNRDGFVEIIEQSNKKISMEALFSYFRLLQPKLERVMSTDTNKIEKFQRGLCWFAFGPLLIVQRRWPLLWY